MIKINDIIVARFSGYEVVGRVTLVGESRTEIVIKTCTEISNGRPASRLMPGELFMVKPQEIIMNRTTLSKSVADLDLL